MQTRSPATRRVSDQATGLRLSVSRTTSPLRGTRYASSFSIPFSYTPQCKGGAACLRDIPCGNVVSRWTLVEMAALQRATFCSQGPVELTE